MGTEVSPGAIFVRQKRRIGIGWYLRANLSHQKKGRPPGLALKCARSTAGGPGSDPGRAPTHRFSGHAEAVSHIQQLEGCAPMAYNYLLGLWGKRKVVHI